MMHTLEQRGEEVKLTGWGQNQVLVLLLASAHQLLSCVPDTKPSLGTASLGTGRPGVPSFRKQSLVRVSRENPS